jgi:uncharacterized membrane protein YkoI
MEGDYPFMKAAVFCALTAGTLLVFGAETKVKLESLPQAVQNTVKEQTKTATLVGLSTEVENGKRVYEIETKVDGKGRDLTVNAAGTVLEVEQELDLAAVPAAAMAAIQKKAGSGTVSKVESVTAGAKVYYEAGIKTSAGKAMEFSVNADGSVHKQAD